MMASANAGRPHHPFMHKPRPSASNSNVNINTNKNDNTNYNNLISSLLSQLIGNEEQNECVYGDFSCFEKMLGAKGLAKEKPETTPENEDSAVPEEDNAEILGLEKASADVNSKRYRPNKPTRPSGTSNYNFNSNSNSNSNNDLNSLFASLQQFLDVDQKKRAAKAAPSISAE